MQEQAAPVQAAPVVFPWQALRSTGDRQLLVRSGPVYILLHGIPCELTEAQLTAMAQGAHGLDHVLTYNPFDPGFAVYVFRNKAAALLGYDILLSNIQLAGPQVGWWPERISVIQRRNLIPPLERVARLKAMDAADATESLPASTAPQQELRPTAQQPQHRPEAASRQMLPAPQPDLAARKQPNPLELLSVQLEQPVSAEDSEEVPPPPPSPPPPDVHWTSTAQQSQLQPLGPHEANPLVLLPELGQGPQQPEQPPLPEEVPMLPDDAAVPPLPPHLSPAPAAPLLLARDTAAVAFPAWHLDPSLPAAHPPAAPEQNSNSFDFPVQLDHLPPHLQAAAPAKLRPPDLLPIGPKSAAVPRSPVALPPPQDAALQEAAPAQQRKLKDPEPSSSQQAFVAAAAENHMDGAKSAEVPSVGSGPAEVTINKAKLAGMQREGAEPATVKGTLTEPAAEQGGREQCSSGPRAAGEALLNGRKSRHSSEPPVRGDRARRAHEKRRRKRSRSRSRSRSRWRRSSRSRSMSRSRSRRRHRSRSRSRSRSRNRSRSRSRSRNRSRSRSRRWSPTSRADSGTEPRRNGLSRVAKERRRGNATGDQRRGDMRQSRTNGADRLQRPDRRSVVRYVEQQTQSRGGDRLRGMERSCSPRRARDGNRERRRSRPRSLEREERPSPVRSHAGVRERRKSPPHPHDGERGRSLMHSHASERECRNPRSTKSHTERARELPERKVDTEIATPRGPHATAEEKHDHHAEVLIRHGDGMVLNKETLLWERTGEVGLPLAEDRPRTGSMAGQHGRLAGPVAHQDALARERGCAVASPPLQPRGSAEAHDAPHAGKSCATDAALTNSIRRGTDAEDAVTLLASPDGMLADREKGLPALQTPAPLVQDPTSGGPAPWTAMGPSSALQTLEVSNSKRAKPVMDEVPLGSGRRVSGHSSMDNKPTAGHTQEDHLESSCATVNGSRHPSGVTANASTHRPVGNGSCGVESTEARAHKSPGVEQSKQVVHPGAQSCGPAVVAQPPGKAGVKVKPERPLPPAMDEAKGSSAKEEGEIHANSGAQPSNSNTEGAGGLGGMSTAACSLPLPPMRGSLQQSNQHSSQREPPPGDIGLLSLEVRTRIGQQLSRHAGDGGLRREHFNALVVKKLLMLSPAEEQHCLLSLERTNWPSVRHPPSFIVGMINKQRQSVRASDQQRYPQAKEHGKSQAREAARGGRNTGGSAHGAQ